MVVQKNQQVVIADEVRIEVTMWQGIGVGVGIPERLSPTGECVEGSQASD